MRADTSGYLPKLKQRLAELKHPVSKCRGALDYHGLECESTLTFLCNKLTHLYMSPEA